MAVNGAPSLRTKALQMEFHIKQGANSMKIRVYAAPVATMLSSPPRRRIMPSGTKMPSTKNTIPAIVAKNSALEKYASAFFSPFPFATAKRIAAPTPIMAPIAKIRLYMGSTRFNAVMPSAPTDSEIKKVSARIYSEIPTIPNIFCNTYLKNCFLICIFILTSESFAASAIRATHQPVHYSTLPLCPQPGCRFCGFAVLRSGAAALWCSAFRQFLALTI